MVRREEMENQEPARTNTAPGREPDLLDWLLSLPKKEADAMRNILTKMVRREEMENQEPARTNTAPVSSNRTESV